MADQNKRNLKLLRRISVPALAFGFFLLVLCLATGDRTLAAAPPAIDSSGWLKVTSVNGVFSIRIPDGWDIINATNMDAIEAVSLDDIEYRPGVKVTIRQGEMPKGDGIPRIYIFRSMEVKPYQPPSFTQSKEDNFDLANGIIGKRYTVKFVTVPEAWRIGYVEGELDYVFTFHTTKKTFYLIYRILPDEPDRIPIVEECVKTMMFEK
jgi:hypothetical protein